jgi:Putative zinc-finger
MTECANPEIRDELPDLLHGHLDGAARVRVESHLRDCGECRREFELLRTLRAVAPAPAVDVAGIVGTLPAPRRRASWSPPLWQIAAAVVLLAVGGSTVLTYMDHARPADSAAIATMASRQAPSGGSAAGQSGGVELAVGYGYTDLTDSQLEALLKDVQDLKAVPMTEPDVSVPDVPIENGG